MLIILYFVVITMIAALSLGFYLSLNNKRYKDDEIGYSRYHDRKESAIMLAICFWCLPLLLPLYIIALYNYKLGIYLFGKYFSKLGL